MILPLNKPKLPASLARTLDSSLFEIEHANGGLITLPGGVPIVDQDGVLIGALGVSGNSVENDHQVAKAAVDVIGPSDLPSHP